MMTNWQLILCASILSGLTVAVGLVLLVSPLILRIPHRWMRRLSGGLAGLTIVASAVEWVFSLLHFFLMANINSYTKVSAEDGQSVVVSSGGFDPESYQVYTQRSAYIYEYQIRA
ncbi:hypothetical protein [Arthrobacter sp. H35-D1]|uniref:hypothetical protein n=1 Tax=Arthrobacter sp. H35-D1 TaxID=3046202 RepID=UPI0024B88231|nr:hypothetical protein [Arthrobacter sp. H35-D1]MDJ0312590.1 hypothetical protein [Arthrobacter sp. H35-D1]